jgi:response regulator RpfG family c-di-GMP phosphodiesterase
LVDDAHEILNLLEEQLLELGHEVRAFQDPLKAADALRNGTESYCCILTDYDMPGINGLDLLQVANEHQPLASRIMISGHADLSLAMKAINEGSIFRFMLKPWKLNELKQIVDESVARFEETEEKHLMQEQLKLLNLELSAANLRLHENLEELTHFSRHLMTTFSPLLGETTRIVCDLCEEFCQLGIFDEQQQRLLRLAAVFHNVGLINTTRMTVKKSFLKPRQLTREEARIVQLHPEYPESLLHFRGELEPVTKIIRAHHERWDGSGYPDGLSRNTIPYLSNFLALACYYAECDSYRDEVIVRIRDLKKQFPHLIKS